jgi:protein tyrosine/serine phosphatase
MVRIRRALMPRFIRFATLVVALSFALGCANTTTATNIASPESAPRVLPNPGVPNLRLVRPGLYRGGRPSAAGLEYLKSIGVKRILNLEVGDFIEAFPWIIARELREARRRGLMEQRFPMSAFDPATSGRFDARVNEMMEVLKTATPDDAIFVHCAHGQDRTGLVIALERVIDEHWEPKVAYAEMRRTGFHPYFLGLKHYFETKTGFED